MAVTGYLGYDEAAIERQMYTTLAEHMTEVESALLRNFQFGALLDARGRVSYNHGGRGFSWPVAYKLHELEGETGMSQRVFTPTNQWKEAHLNYRGYRVQDTISRRELYENRTKEGIIKVYDTFVSRLEESLKQRLGNQYFIDGNATGNEQYWHGLESMFAVNGTVNVSTGAQRSANAADLVGYPSDTYASLSTILGNYNGDNESGQVWPNGVADSEYDFWSPLVVNYTSTAFGGAADTFAAQGDEAIRYGLIHSQRNTSQSGQVENVMLARNLFYDLKNLIDNKEQLTITNGTQDNLWSLGFKNVVRFDGVEVSYDNGIPSGVGYGFNAANIELRSMAGQLFETEGPTYDHKNQAYEAVVSTLSNLKLSSPRNFFKLAALA